MNEISEILNDVKKSITGELGIGGSLAQRFLAPELSTLKEKPVDKSDLDLLLLPIDGSCEVKTLIKEKFFIIEISPSNGAYYFGLIHKKTKKWVDLFPKSDKSGLTPIEIDRVKYLAEGIESQAAYLTKDILRRNSYNLPVRGKWINKLQDLYNYPSLNKNLLSVSEAEVHQALNVKPSTKLKDWISTMRQLFKSKTTTPNGLSAQPVKFYF